MNLLQYISNPENYKQVHLKEHEVWAYMPPVGTKVHNESNNITFTTTEENCIVIKRDTGSATIISKRWVVSQFKSTNPENNIAKELSLHTKYYDDPITGKECVVMTPVRIIETNPFVECGLHEPIVAAYIPLSIKGEIPGVSMIGSFNGLVNSNDTRHHGPGDFVIRSGIIGSEMSQGIIAVNGLDFIQMFDMRAFPKLNSSKYKLSGGIPSYKEMNIDPKNFKTESNRSVFSMMRKDTDPYIVTDTDRINIKAVTDTIFNNIDYDKFEPYREISTESVYNTLAAIFIRHPDLGEPVIKGKLIKTDTRGNYKLNEDHTYAIYIYGIRFKSNVDMTMQFELEGPGMTGDPTAFSSIKLKFKDQESEYLYDSNDKTYKIRNVTNEGISTLIDNLGKNVNPSINCNILNQEELNRVKTESMNKKLNSILGKAFSFMESKK